MIHSADHPVTAPFDGATTWHRENKTRRVRSADRFPFIVEGKVRTADPTELLLAAEGNVEESAALQHCPGSVHVVPAPLGPALRYIRAHRTPHTSVYSSLISPVHSASPPKSSCTLHAMQEDPVQVAPKARLGLFSDLMVPPRYHRSFGPGGHDDIRLVSRQRSPPPPPPKEVGHPPIG